LGHLDGHVFISPSQKRIRVLHIRVGDFLHIDLTHHSATRSRFNRRKLEDQRRETAENETASRRATDAQVLEDAQRLIAAWNERQAKQMPMLFSPTIGAAITVGYWFLWVRCPACRTTNAIDLHTLDRHRDAAITSLISDRL
jgi:hypothetical protein